MIRVFIFITILLFLAGCNGVYGTKSVDGNTESVIIAMEKAALDRWIKGDPSGFLEISANDVVYFDPSLEHRIDGIEKLTGLYESVRGKIFADRYALLSPKVQICGNAAILTFNFISYPSQKNNRWNCTEVYCRRNDQWRIIQTHWSLTQPFK